MFYPSAFKASVKVFNVAIACRCLNGIVPLVKGFADVKLFPLDYEDTS